MAICAGRMIGRRRRRGWPLAVLAGVSAVLVGCAAPAPTGSAAATSPQLPAVTSASASTGTAAASAPATVAPPVALCPKGALPTLATGTLTIGTGSPAAAPWFVGGSPSSGQGLESAFGYAVADALGYGREQVGWTVVDPAAAAAGTARGFDIDLNQFTAPDAGTPTADYSTGYFSVTDTLLMSKAATAAPPGSVQAVQSLRLGAVSGSPSAAVAQQVAGSDPTSFPDESAALAGVTSGTVAGIVLPTPAALAAAAADPGLLLVGRLPTDPREQPEQLKALLAKGSPLTGCVSAAIDRLRVEGTLDQLAQQWIDPLVPELR